MGMIRLGIVGTRTFKDKNYFEQVMKEYNPEFIVTGDANGTDHLARMYALENNIPFIFHAANWEVYGKAAGPMRNEKIVKDSDMILAFWNHKSRGTKSTIELAKKHHKEVIIIPLPQEKRID
jgi:adenine/guanine phosphoribosyltransferase-like PRPP-binding protein